MKYLYLILVLFIICLPSGADEKPSKQEPIVEKVDKKLDPFYFTLNFDEIVTKRKTAFRIRKGNLPEQIWKIKTKGTITTQPLLLENKLLIATSLGNINYLDLNTGESEKVFGSAGGMVAWMSLRNNDSIVAMTWAGSLVCFSKGWENHTVNSGAAYATKETSPLGGITWLAGCIITRRDKFPVMIEMKDGKVTSEPNKSWASGEATAPLIFTGSSFWLATSKSELISIDTNLVNVTSIIRLEKSYATALASEGNFLYAVTANKELLSYDTTTSTLKWKLKLDGYCVNSMVCEAGLLYVNAGSFYVINCEDGKILLEQKSRSYENFMRTKPLLSQKRIYTCDSEGNIFIFNKKELKFIQVINIEEDVMVDFFYQDKVLYVPTIIGNLYAIDVSLY